MIRSGARPRGRLLFSAVAGIAALLLAPPALTTGCAADEERRPVVGQTGACSDPQLELRIALRGESDALLSAALDKLTQALTPAEMDYLAQIDWAKVTDDEVFHDATVLKGVLAIQDLVTNVCAKKSASYPSLIEQAHAVDIRCLVARGNATVIAAGFTGLAARAACVATGTLAPICVVGTMIAVAIVVSSSPVCAAELTGGGGSGGGGAGGVGGWGASAGAGPLGGAAGSDGGPDGGDESGGSGGTTGSGGAAGTDGGAPPDAACASITMTPPSGTCQTDADCLGISFPVPGLTFHCNPPFDCVAGCKPSAPDGGL